MDINLFEAAVLVMAGWIVWNVMRGGRWNRATRRWERHSPDNPYVRAGQLPAEDLRARKELEELRQRVTTLERLVTDPAFRLDAEIARLRGDTPPERRPEDPFPRAPGAG